MPDAIRQLTEDLVSIPSVTADLSACAETVEYVERYFAGTDLIVRRYDNQGRLSLVVGTADTLTPDVLLLGHLDVVPGPDELFRVRQEGSKLFGRGVCDMKSEDAVMMRLVRELAGKSRRPSVALMLTTDEETGGFDGTRHLVEDVGYRAKVALVPDGGHAPEDLILTNKGILHLELRAKGMSGHGSRPWLGKNAIDALVDDYRNVRVAFPLSNDAEHWHDTCNIGVIAGGAVVNQIADRASAKLDFRYVETSSADGLLARVRELAPHCEVIELARGGSSHTDAHNHMVATFAEALRETNGAAIKPNRSCGGNDGRFLTAHGIPVIVSRPISDGQHSDLEWVDLESLEVFERVCRAFIEKATRTG